ncbi:Carbohydrate-binding protein [Nitrospira japonica]|uniref:Carbohydrate-binding protein n=1 Tax=Nitrospira japonica TaxID=1325564 RepID=A0A1W1I0M9_9BACT|nr:carbohydrate-binding protein [Nitrospira japonica]SLM46555.1 Carbohydrate-binding protein [Nitrospira japonica]
MRKRFIGRSYSKTALSDPEWLGIEHLADVEVTSEDPARPIENALLPDRPSGWRAGMHGEQVIRLLFSRPTTIKRIRLEFVESVLQRTQEYTLRWSAGGSQPLQHIVRQQWNFSPRGSIREIEDHDVDLPGAVMLELTIIPDIAGTPATASLIQWRIG